MTILPGSSSCRQKETGAAALKVAGRTLLGVAGNASCPNAPGIAPCGPGIVPYGPGIAFSIWPTYDHSDDGPYFVVRIFETNRQMMRHERREVRRAGQFWGLCDALTGYEWPHRNFPDKLPCGTILLSQDRLDVGMVAHELQHAALHYGILAKLRYRRMEKSKKNWHQKIGPSSRTEEDLAGITENLTRHFYRRIAEFGITNFPS